MKAKNAVYRALFVLILLLLCWIWGNSLLSKETSTKISRRFEKEVKPFYYALMDLVAREPDAVGDVVITPTPVPTATPYEPETAAKQDEKAVVAPTPTPAPTATKKKDVRKYAHFAEFALLGILVSIYGLLRSKLTFQKLMNILSFGLFIAVADESIQILSGRGPLVKDVLLDMAGYGSGTAVSLVIGMICVGLFHVVRHNRTT